MKYIVTGEEMKSIDDYSIAELGMPGIVLMERAALSVVEEIEKRFPEHFNKEDSKELNVLVVAEKGNNGGDGLAAARLLMDKGAKVDIVEIGAVASATESYLIQRNILEKTSCVIFSIDDFFNDMGAKESCGVDSINLCSAVFKHKEYDVIIDAIFGVGLSREVSGIHKKVIEIVNSMRAFKLAVDIPSGVNATTAKIMGAAFKADLTVTFGFNKRGLILHPGSDIAGEVVVRDIGFPSLAVEHISPASICFDNTDFKLLPKRPDNSHKGTYGRTLIIAGSKNMAGACYLAATAAMRSGAGLVEIFTTEENRNILQTLCPQAVMTTYDSIEDAILKLAICLNRATAVCIGPGLGTEAITRELLFTVFRFFNGTLVIDADAINVLADPDMALKDAFYSYEGDIILTPHILEMSRISTMPIPVILDDIVAVASNYHRELNKTSSGNRILVLKDSKTIVCGGDNIYINLSGNSGMAKGGSGDVLTGIIGGLLSQRCDTVNAARLGVYLHGLAGDSAAVKHGKYNMLPEDMLKEIIHKY